MIWSFTETHGESLQPIGDGYAIIVRKGEELPLCVRSTFVASDGWSAMGLGDQGDVKLIAERGDDGLNRALAPIIDHDHFKVGPRIVEASQGLKAGGQLAWPVKGGDNDREKRLFFSHPSFHTGNPTVIREGHVVSIKKIFLTPRV
jgi:hypothetical protein